jgi:NADPH oxidase
MELQTINASQKPSESEEKAYHNSKTNYYLSRLKNLRYLIVRIISCPLPFITNYIPIIGGKSAVEILSIFALIIITLAVCLATGKDGIAIGNIADGIFGATIVLGLRNNLLTLLFGISFERALSYHKWFAIAGMLAMIIHGISLGPNDTGFVIVALFGTMSILYTWKPYYFNLFYFAHVICFFVSIFVGAAHGASIYPFFSIIWSIDLILRYCITLHSENADIKILPGNIIKIDFESTFKYEPGQYCFLMIPIINRFEYHPFSVSSSPFEKRTSFHIRALGDWTQKLYDLVDGENGLKKIDVKIEGPFGNAAINLNDSNYEVSIVYLKNVCKKKSLRNSKV